MLRKAHISQPSIILGFKLEIMNASLELGNNENQIAIRLMIFNKAHHYPFRMMYDLTNEFDLNV